MGPLANGLRGGALPFLASGPVVLEPRFDPPSALAV